jgi:oxygen-independent coproporphyrinogen-3 oxidase
MRGDAPGFGIYVHWPFCAQKCPYCDFNSHVRMQGWDEASFLRAYLRELDHAADVTGRAEAVTSIFFGGGTPSLMQPATVARIIDHIANLWPVADGAEITLEANPGSVEARRFTGYRTAGVNRVSVGVQALDEDALRRLGRIHSVAEAKAALEIARSTFARFSFDLIYARPDQSLGAWRAELTEALALVGGHLSLYQLTIEDGTPFAALHKCGRLVVPEDDHARALYDLTQELMAAAGLPAYEISNHARAGEESRHNLTYWRYGAYVGVGAGAHGRLRRAADGALLATATERSPEAWRAAVERHGHGLVEHSVLSRAEQADEMILMGLRIAEGLDLLRLASSCGVKPDPGVLQRLAAARLIEADALPSRLSVPVASWSVLDRIVTDVAESLVPVADVALPSAAFPV